MGKVCRSELRKDVLIRLYCRLELLHGFIPPCDLNFFLVLVGFNLLPVHFRNEGGRSPHAFIKHAKWPFIYQDGVMTNSESLSEEVVVDEVPIPGVQIRSQYHGRTRKGQTAA